jgi:hypothetical protein
MPAASQPSQIWLTTHNPSLSPSLSLPIVLTSVSVRYEHEEEDLSQLGPKMRGLHSPGTAKKEYHEGEDCTVCVRERNIVEGDRERVSGRRERDRERE